ncbi:hypothetical protein GJV44_00626 [Candidatus Vallotia cooleyia]|nr:hypothetical protein GJV44_00626 [Candidatus Vallotia cooleyia]
MLYNTAALTMPSRVALYSELANIALLPCIGSTHFKNKPTAPDDSVIIDLYNVGRVK